MADRDIYNDGHGFRPFEKRWALIDLERMTAEQLNDWYEERVGYRPQEDHPAMSVDTLRSLCIGYAALNEEDE